MSVTRMAPRQRWRGISHKLRCEGRPKHRREPWEGAKTGAILRNFSYSMIPVTERTLYGRTMDATEICVATAEKTCKVLSARRLPEDAR